jgi:Chaperone of endosialidase
LKRSALLLNQGSILAKNNLECTMKNPKMQLAVLLLSTLSLLTSAYAQLTPSADAYTNSALPTTNYGAATLLYVENATATQTAYIQFNLSSIPSGYTGAGITKATLKLYVNAVTTAGSFNVDYVNGAWAEKTITANLAPALGTTIAASVPLTTASKNQYILIDITAAVQAWLNGSQPNDGIALVGNSPLNANFDSKESTSTSHAAELDMVFVGGGTITGITTASGSGLTGGGSSGTLNLSLIHTCAANQVLQWNGSAWVCASPGTGTVTSVGSGVGLTGGPITGSGTLSLDTTKVPLLAASNTFTGNQTVNGNLSATGVVTGSSFQIGSNLFAFGSLASANAFFGFAGNTGITGTGNTAAGYNALEYNTAGNNNTAAGEFAGKPADLTSLAGSNNTALGAFAYFGTGTLSNATAIGANALVTESNALVLGSINGLNNATASTNVGIGTAAPISALDVDADVKGGPGPSITLTNLGGGQNASTSLDFNSYAPHTGASYNPAASIIAVDAGGWSDELQFLSNIPGTYNNGMFLNMVIMPNGQVGINAFPDQQLTVNGNADKPGGGSWGTYSDGRLKNLNGNFNSGLSQVLKIHPVRYRYKPDNAMGIHDPEEHIGVVAQEVQRVIPEAVTENSKGYLLVNNDPVIWAMVNAIKEQQGEFRQQQAELAKALRQIRQQQSLLRAQTSAMRNLKAEARGAREKLRKVEAQVASTQPMVVAAK